MNIYEKECHHAGIDDRKLRKLGQKLEKLLKEFAALNVVVFSTGAFRYNDGHPLPLILGYFDNFSAMDGGDGSYCYHEDGFMRGE
jgi:hypothetical protein